MMAGGDDGVVKAARPARRPSIRQKAVTPPRAGTPTPPLAAMRTGTWTLPPVRTPEPRIARRPVLTLVDVDAALESCAMRELPIQGAPWWKEPRGLALLVASIAAVAFATSVVVWAATAPRPYAGGVSSNALASPSVASPVPPAVASPSAGEQVIPVVDVNSLPPAPNRIATDSSR